MTPSTSSTPDAVDRASGQLLAPVALILSRGIQLPRLPALLAGALWTFGFLALLGLADRAISAWSQPIWLGWAACLWWTAAIAAAFILIPVLGELHQGSRPGGCMARAFAAASANVGARGRALLRVAAPLLLCKTAWLVMILLAAIPGIGATLYVLLAPLRMLAELAFAVALAWGAALVLLVPLVQSQAGVDIAQAVTIAKRLIRSRLVVFLEVSLWLGIPTFVAIALLDGCVRGDVSAGMTVLGGEQAFSLFSSAPAPFRGLANFPGLSNPFAYPGEAASTWGLILSCLLVTAHVAIVVPALTLLGFQIAGSLRALVAELLRQEQSHAAAGGAP